MNFPKRMPVMASQDKIRRQWLAMVCAVDALYGMLTIFGKSEGAPQVLLRQILPSVTPIWGAVLVATASLLWFGYSVTGGSIGVFAWTVLAAAAMVTIVTGTAQATAGPVLPGFLAILHGLIAYQVGSGLDRDRERRQRRQG